MLAWASEQLDIPDFGPAAAIGVWRRDKIVAVAVFNNYRWPNIEISFARTDPYWATREAIAAILRFPFVQLQCKRLTAITKAQNKPARAFLERLGFRQEGIHPDTFADDDAVTYGLLAADAARWLGETHGQEQRAERA